MKITKETLKQIIKEEFEAIQGTDLADDILEVYILKLLIPLSLV